MPTVATLALWPSGVVAQELRPLEAPAEYAIDQWTTAEGLPQNSINAIVQGRDGYLWLGTFGGLARFDGTSFTLIERSDSTGRHIDRVLSLAAAPDSALWIGTEDGLLRLKNGAFVLFTTADGLPGNEIAALHVSRSGVLWIGAGSGGIARFTDGRFETFSEVDGVPVSRVSSITEDLSGTVWINVNDRYLTIENGVPSDARWRSRPRGLIHMLFADSSGAHWFSSARGVVRVSGDEVRRHGGDELPEASLMVAAPGRGFWLGTRNDGVYFLRPDGGLGEVTRYALPDGRRTFRVRSAFVDLDGNIWLGTNANGLLRAKRNLFTTYTTAHGLSHDVATSIYVDAAGTTWIGTNCGGVNAIDRERRTVRIYNPRASGDPEGDPCVFALGEAPHGTVWQGTFGGGVTAITREGEELEGVVGLPDSVVLALFTDRDGTLWVGTNTGGLAAVRDGRVFALYSNRDGLPSNSIRVVQQTRDGALWIGSLGGLSRMSGGVITSYTAADGLSAEHVRAIHEDADGNLWIGTYGGGINRFRDGVFTSVTREDGLADDVVSTILEDDYGYFWMSGNRGIYRVARSELVSFMDGHSAHVHSVLYGIGDGLRNAETNGGFQPAGWEDAHGHLWFPTLEGVAVVDPARETGGVRPPSVTLEEIVVNGVAQAPGGPIVIGPDRSNLEFGYTGLSLSAPEHVTYRYRLEGFDEAWVVAGTRRVAYYPRLEPGHYRFIVSAANRDGSWGVAAASPELRVIPPFWNTWGFRIAALAVLLLSVALVVRRRETMMRRQRAAQEEFSRRLIESQEHERKRIAGELHDGLGQELLVVKNRALLALRTKDLDARTRDQLNQIDDVVTASLASVRGLAHRLSPHQLDHLGLSSALRTMVETVSETAEIATDASIEDIDGLLAKEGEINLYRVVQEGLNNVVRHAGATFIVVEVRRAGYVIAITIRDDGRGFRVQRDAAGRLAGGFGLSGIEERVRILEGRVHISSEPGRGTVLRVYVPVAQARIPAAPPATPVLQSP